MASGIVWSGTPLRTMETNIGLYGARVMVAVRALADYIAAKIQNEARANAPWRDRTGNARTGLFAVADQAARDATEIYLSHGHTIHYGLWLEVAHGQKYAIIMPTLERNIPEIERMLRDLLA